jgi:mannose-6-phosphate isomerase-like protein (cupin superfamily)
MGNRLCIHEKDSPAQQDICGTAIDLINSQVSPVKALSLATIFIDGGKSSQPHYHKVMEEIYYFIAGHGEVIVGDETFAIEPGTAVFIPVGNTHQVINRSDERLKFVTADSPSFNPADIYYH